MSKLKNYRQYIQKVILEYGQKEQPHGDITTEFVFDTVGDHYQLIRVGWRDDHWIYGCLIHMDIINDQIWIQYNGTEVDFAPIIVALGVPKQDIVLAFHSPYKRQFTEYAVS
ncbi:XisI protein [Chroococcus sp. FPU101]|uniref:XisI protein n=1 Tax=Chroococcus sp. FPU101 TaxID=1974212 RepID=UPI001A8F6732